jgi:hypothetical protein
VAVTVTVTAGLAVAMAAAEGSRPARAGESTRKVSNANSGQEWKLIELTEKKRKK